MAQALAWVALGGALGGMARVFLADLVGRRAGAAFPWGTLAVNGTGSLLIGIAAAAAGRHPWLLAPETWQLAVVGVLGSYTTVSSFSLQTLALARSGELLRAGGNVLLSMTLCLAAVAAGFAIGSAIPGQTGI